MAVWSNNSPSKNQSSINWRGLCYAISIFISVVILPAFFIFLFMNMKPQNMADLSNSVSQNYNVPALFALDGVHRDIDCVAALGDYLEEQTIYFDVNSALLSNADKVTILKISEALKTCPEAQIYVYGHADATGADSVNDQISWDRAEAVMQFLASVSRPTEKFRAHGQGAKESHMFGDSDDSDGGNRRVAFEAHAVR